MNTIDRAIEVAAKAHNGQVRKGTDIPYISHPYTVGLMLQRAGCSDSVIAAGILHDTIEDTNLTVDDLRRDFGEHVAAIVEGCSEPEKSVPWEERKRHTLEYLRTAPWEVRAVSCADKLHNLSTIAEALSAQGEQVWQRFKRGRAEQEWYYRGLASVLCSPREGEPPLPFCADFQTLVQTVFAA